MLAKSIQKLFVFIFLIAVLERTGGDLASLIQWQFENNDIEVFEAESTPKESEKKEEKSLKEFWICTIYQSLIKPASNDNLRLEHFNNIHRELNFYPSIPTPPPNIPAV